MAPYTSRFINQHGETWEFEYDPRTGEGILRGSDADWQEYRVIEGRAAGLILADEEIEWLRGTWALAAHRHGAGRSARRR